MRGQKVSGNRRISGGERGFALVFALVFTFLLTLVALNFQGLGSLEADLIQRQATHSQALYLAEAGLERSIYHLYTNPAWRGADGVAFWGEPLANGSYDVLLCDAPDGCEDFCTDLIAAGQLCLSSTGTAGPNGAGSSRRIETRVKVENSLNPPSFFFFPGEMDKVKLRDHFLIDGHDTDPLTGNREIDPCRTIYGITSQGNIGEIQEELADQGTEDQVIGRDSTPSVAQVNDGADVNQLVDKILADSQGQSFYHSFTDKKIEADTIWGSYPNDLWVVRVEGDLEVKNQKTLSGAGILIVEDELKIDNKSTFNWTGLVIVANKDGKDDEDVELDHKGGGTLYGALLIGGGNGESELELKPDPHSGINGARFFYSCDALDALATFSPSFKALRKVETRSWREVRP